MHPWPESAHPVHTPLTEDSAPPVDPAVLGALLRRHGWQRRGGAAGRYARWTPPGPAHGRISLLIPETRSYPDSEDLLSEALAVLSRSELPCAREVLVGLAVPSDEVHLVREAGSDLHPDLRLRSPWTVEDQLRTAARQLLLAGAMAERARAGYHGARHRARAGRALDEVLLAPPVGGRLTAYLPVGQGRGLVARLHHALHAAREAIDYQRATGGMEVFDSAVEAGVSRELADALIALVHGAEGARIALAWAPAAGPPPGCAARPEPVEFTAGDLPALREAAARYTRQEPAVAVTLTGAVTRMRRSAPGGGGTVRLRVLAGAEVPNVSVALDEGAYRIAGHAHLVGLPVRLSGRLQRRGGFRRLTGAGEVTPVRLDDAERERLMKSLQEDLGSFEEACTGEDEPGPDGGGS
ncbi:hypothetical protein [Streptomyces sp. NPDC006879]|uniref:hypothetical protein n=1 Tax=Streptomyces sp. NPDC006879 TaxID=3364767 RepID=UPI0036A5722C